MTIQVGQTVGESEEQRRTRATVACDDTLATATPRLFAEVLDQLARQAELIISRASTAYRYIERPTSTLHRCVFGHPRKLVYACCDTVTL
jgi:hypothetical protein